MQLNFDNYFIHLIFALLIILCHGILYISLFAKKLNQKELKRLKYYLQFQKPKKQLQLMKLSIILNSI